MSDELIVRHCSPTLAGLKAGSLFSCRCDSPCALTAELRRLIRALAPKGLRVLPLQVREGRALIYHYRPRALEKELRSSGARRLLEERGYLPGQCVAQLARRVRAEGAVPPRDRAVSELPARGRGGLHLQRSLRPQVRRLLEGVRRRGRRPAHLRGLAALHPHLQPAAGGRLSAGKTGGGRLTARPTI